MSMMKDSLKKNHSEVNLDYETKMIMNCKNPFAVWLENFEGRKL